MPRQQAIEPQGAGGGKDDLNTLDDTQRRTEYRLDRRKQGEQAGRLDIEA